MIISQSAYTFFPCSRSNASKSPLPLIPLNSSLTNSSSSGSFSNSPLASIVDEGGGATPLGHTFFSPTRLPKLPILLAPHPSPPASLVSSLLKKRLCSSSCLSIRASLRTILVYAENSASSSSTTARLKMNSLRSYLLPLMHTGCPMILYRFVHTVTRRSQNSWRGIRS